MNPLEFRGGKYPVSVWKPVDGRVDGVISYDTETTSLQGSGKIPSYVLGTVCDGRRVYLLRRNDLLSFWRAHADCVVYMHSAPFDIAVTTEASGFDFSPMVEAGFVRDISIYFRLLGIAVEGEVPHRYSLQLMCSELLGVELEKGDGIREDFGRFYRDGEVTYRAIPERYLAYAALDAIATYSLGGIMESGCREVCSAVIGEDTDEVDASALPWGLLGHDIQIRGDIALHRVERNGLHVDHAAVKDLEESLQERIRECCSVMERYGFKRGQKGNQSVYGRIIEGIEHQRGIMIPRTPKTGKISQAAGDLVPFSDHPFVEAFLKEGELAKILNTYVKRLEEDGDRVHPRYNLLVRTGRTSCSAPNIQNLPREGGVRECIAAPPGYRLVACDYRMLELCTLAQILHDRYGSSVMRELINEGVDLHRHVAAKVLGIDEENVTREDRQKAKAVNFGLPGGMGVCSLQDYARSSYNVDLTAEEACTWKDNWLRLFPEMAAYLDDNDSLGRLGEMLELESYPGNQGGLAPQAAGGIVIRVAGGHAGTTTGRMFSDEELDWAWDRIADRDVRGLDRFAADIRARKGSKELQRMIAPKETVSISTGRICANRSYTEARNWPFQALAADGAKLALYDLVLAGYKVVAFIHDEVLVEVPESSDYKSVADSISECMTKAMGRLCPDVVIRTEYAVMQRWRKGAEAVYDDEGRLVAVEDA